MLNSVPVERTAWSIYVHFNLQEQVKGPLTTIYVLDSLDSQQEKANTFSLEISS